MRVTPLHHLLLLLITSTYKKRPELADANAAGPRSQPLQPKAMAGSGTDGQQLGVLLELDGVLVDTHRDGHRTAFNRAFAVCGQ